MKKDKINSNLQKATSGFAWMGFLSVLSILINTATTAILSRLFSPEEFGIVSTIMIIISFSSIFWMMGVGPAIVQKKILSEEDVTTGNTLNILFGIIVYVIVFAISRFLADYLGISDIRMIWVLSLLFIIQSFSSVTESLYQRQMLFKRISLINLLQMVSYGILSTIFAFLGLGVWALILGNVFSVLIKTVLVLIMSPIKLSIQIKSESAKALLYYGGGHTLARLFNTLAVQGDNLVVTKTLGKEMLGLYSRAYSLLNIPADIIGRVMDSVLFPLLSQYQDNKQKLRYVYNNISVIIMLLTLPITTLSVILSDEIIVFFLSEKWVIIHEPFAILMLSLFFRTAYKISDSLVRSVGAVYKRIVFQIVYTVMVIGGSYIGHFFGLKGIAWAVGIAIVINYILMLAMSVQLIDIKIFDFVRMHCPVLLLGTITFLLTKLFFSFIPNSWPKMLVIIITSSIYLILYVTFLTTLTWRLITKETREFIISVLQSYLDKVKLKSKWNNYIQKKNSSQFASKVK